MIKNENKREVYVAPSVECIALENPLSLLAQASLDVTGEFGDLENQDDWYGEPA